MELREQIVEVIDNYIQYLDRSKAIADAILALPEIKEALAAKGREAKGGYWEITGTGKGNRQWVPAGLGHSIKVRDVE